MRGGDVGGVGVQGGVLLGCLWVIEWKSIPLCKRIAFDWEIVLSREILFYGETRNFVGGKNHDFDGNTVDALDLASGDSEAS